jgi:hypothetical protein
MRFFSVGLALLPVAALLGANFRPPVSPAGGPKVPPGKIKSVYVATPPTIDGQTTEWTDSLQYDTGSKMQYLVLNDGRTMYLRVKINDTPTQAKFVYLGTVVWLDSTGRNQQQLGIRFPLPVDLESLPKGESRPAGAMGPSAAERLADHQSRLRQVLLNAKEMELLNFRGSKEPVLADAQSLLGVKAALALDPQGNLIYELAVPLRLIYKRVPNLAAGQAATVGLTLAGQKPKMPKSDSSSDPYSAMNSGGMGGGYGRGMGGGGMRGGPQYSFSTFNLRTSAQLADK